MSARFGRRLFVFTALQIALALGALVVSGALFAFGAYVGTVRGEIATTAADAVASLAQVPGVRRSRAAAGIIAARYVPPDVEVVLFDGGTRSAVYRLRRGDPRETLTTQRRGQPPGEPHAEGPLAMPILGLATAFGIEPAHARSGDLDIAVRADERRLVSTVGAFLPPVLLALLAAALAAILIARIATRSLLRPLVDVTGALERFAAGDLSPRPIAADGGRDFGALALAYNGAIAQMERAFADRDRANAAMRQFIADAGHELRTPLTVMRGFIAILRKGDLRSPADSERILETMSRQSAVMGSLIEKLMLLEQWERGADRPAEPIDVGRFVEDVASPIAEAQPARDVRIAASAGVLAVIDPIDLAHAVTNLLDNALKYTAGAIDVRVFERAGRVVAEVADEGPGMSEAEVAHVFDRFYRGARRDVDGSGLGLAIAKRAVERAGGTLEVRTSPAAGTTFAIALPPVARAMAAATR